MSESELERVARSLWEAYRKYWHEKNGTWNLRWEIDISEDEREAYRAMARAIQD